MYSQGICPAALLAGPHQIWFCSSLPFSPAVSLCNKAEKTVEAPLHSVNTGIWQEWKNLTCQHGSQRRGWQDTGRSWKHSQRWPQSHPAANQDKMPSTFVQLSQTLQAGSVRWSLWQCSEQQQQSMTPTRLSPTSNKGRQRDKVQNPLDSAETLKTFPDLSHLGTDTEPSWGGLLRGMHLHLPLNGSVGWRVCI